MLVLKTVRAVERTGADTVALGGGVAANRCLRETLTTECSRKGFRFHAAAMPYCMDNAAMIAAYGHHLFTKGEFADLDLAPTAGLQR